MKKISVIIALLVTGLSFSQIMVIEFKNGDIIRFDAKEISSIYFEENTYNVFENLTGYWKGDKGLEDIVIYEDGYASILCENGYSWTTSVEYKDGEYTFRTPYPVPAEYNMNYFPEKASRELMEVLNEPSSWVFKISEGGTKLIGRKYAIYVYWKSDGSLSSWNPSDREAVWERIGDVPVYSQPDNTSKH